MPTRSRSRTAARAFDADAYEQGIEAFVAELEEERYRVAGGRQARPALAGVYEHHGSLFERSALDAIRDRLAAGGDDADRYRALLAFATDGFLGRAVASLADGIAAAEADAVVLWRGEPIPYQAAPSRISGLSDRGERNALFTSWLQAVEAINPQRRERLERIWAVARDLGYRDYVELLAVTRGSDPDALGVSVRQALVATETGYFASMRRAMATVGIEQGDGTLADAWYVLRGSGWDGWFPGRSLVSVVASTVSALGMPLGSDGTSLDSETQPATAPGAYSAAIRTPGDVRLVVNPGDGWEAYRTALHEAGHLVHFASTDPALPTWERLIGDMSVTEGYGMVLDALTGNPDWLSAQLGMREEEQRAFCDFLAMADVYRIRRLGAMHLSELSRHRGGPDAVQRATFAGTYGLLTGVQVPDALYLACEEDAMYYLRGMMVGGAVGEAMAQRHGAGWWRAGEAGTELRGLMAHGLGWNAERVVASLGYDALDWRPVLRKIRTQLIGEMSGYGGPNITTRAGTRKI